jgi:hypothetical protein
MKRIFCTLILLQIMAGPVQARLCLAPCPTETMTEPVRINNEISLLDMRQCEQNFKNEKSSQHTRMTCHQQCESTMGTADTPMDFLYAFFINPLFTLSFLVPEACKNSGQNS